jgi:hypothetical protein
MAMEQSQIRTGALGIIKERVAKTVAQRLDDKQVLQLAIACGMREAEDVLGLLFPPNVAKAALKHQSVTALTANEWRALFGPEINPLRDGGITPVVQSAEFQQPIVAIGAALRCTVAETSQAQRWARAWNKALCYVATHLHNPGGALEAVIGTIVRSDSRRLEELHCTIDDEGCDTMLMSKLIIALSQSVM